MKKLFVLLSAMIFVIVLTGCFADVDTLEWETLPDSIYIQSDDTPIEVLKDQVKIRINNKVYTLRAALGLPDVTFDGFDTKVIGKGLIKITYKTLTIYYQYEVVADTTTPEPVEPTYGWYLGQSSPYTLLSVSDLYGFAAIVNGVAVDDKGTETKDDDTPIAKDIFTGKVVNLGVDIDLSDKVWTPIGEAARKEVVEKTFAELKALNLGNNFPLSTEDEATYKERLVTFDGYYNNKFRYIGKYYFADEVSTGNFKYYYSNADYAPGNFFAGTFDGQNHTITGLSDVGYSPKGAIYYANAERVVKACTYGLFGVVEGHVTVKNLILEDVAISGTYYDSETKLLEISELDSVGAVIGYAARVEGSILIDNVKVTSGSISAYAAAAGLVGRIYTKGNVVIQNSENRASVTTVNTHAGGILGFSDATGTTAFTNNDNYGNISGLSTGAMLRDSNQAVVFTNCRNFGDLSNTNDPLGMVGVTPGSKFSFPGCVNYGKLN